MHDNEFITALKSGDISKIRAVPKSDRHSHSTLASPLEWIGAWSGRAIQKPPTRMIRFSEMEQYLSAALRPVYLTQKGFRFSLRAAFRHAVLDGIRVLEMSIDSRSLYLNNDSAEAVVAFAQQAHAEEAPDIVFIPQLGFDRTHNPEKIRKEADALLATGYFKSIDLYGDELARDASEFSWLYRKAAGAGLTLKIHAGEFGDADSVLRAVETLGVTEIHHGIAAASSAAVMKHLAENNITLHVCPTSNLRLSRVKSINTHPARVLFDHGIKITVNTDDIMIFGQSVTDEFLNLHKSGLFTASELNAIRKTGLQY